MSHKLLDRAKQYSSTMGLGPFTLASTVAGCISICDATLGLQNDGDTTWLCAENGTEWEVFLATRTNSTTIARSGTITSSNGGSPVNFTAPPVLFGTVPASKLSAVGPSFSAYRGGSNQSLVSSTWTKAQLNAVSFDTGNCFDSSTNYRWTPNVAGSYMVSFQSSIAGATLTNGSVAIYKNGAALSYGTFGASSANQSVCSTTHLISMNGTTDYLEFYVFGAGTSVYSAVGEPSTCASAYLAALPGAPMLAPIVAPGPSFSAYLSGASQSLSNGTWTTVAFNSENFDTANCFDSTTTRRFQPNVAGYYNVSWRVNLNCSGAFGSGTQASALYKNNAALATGDFLGNAAPTSTSSSGSALVYMDGTTDYLDVRALATASSGAASVAAGSEYTYFSASLAALPQVPQQIRNSILSAYLTTATNSANGASAKVPIETVVVDSGGMWDAANKRVIPTRAGYYEVIGRVRIVSDAVMALYVLINGSIYQGIGAEGSVHAVGGSALIYCNGTTDYFELFLYTSAIRAITTGLDTKLQVVGPL